jgi:hypothetical protein
LWPSFISLILLVYCLSFVCPIFVSIFCPLLSDLSLFFLCMFVPSIRCVFISFHLSISLSYLLLLFIGVFLCYPYCSFGLSVRVFSFLLSCHFVKTSPLSHQDVRPRGPLLSTSSLLSSLYGKYDQRFLWSLETFVYVMFHASGPEVCKMIRYFLNMIILSSQDAYMENRWTTEVFLRRNLI